MSVAHTLSCIGLIILLAACSNKPDSAPRTADQLYSTYLFTVDDALPDISCLIQFSREKNRRGQFLPPGARLMIDDHELKGDSISIGEVYYESSIDLSAWTGTHQIRLVTEKGSILNEEVSAKPVSLLTQVPAAISRNGWDIAFAGLDKNDRLQLALVDTAFATNDLHIDTAIAGSALHIDSSRFNNLVNGPLIFYLMIEKRRPLQKLKGEVIFRYLFRKDTELTN